MSATLHQTLFTEGFYRIASRIFVVLPAPWKAVTNEDRELLEKILQSIGASTAGVRVLHAETAILDMLAVHQPAGIIIFGSTVNPAVADYQSVSANGIPVVRAGHLSELDNDRKKKLWAALQEFIGSI